MRNIRNSVCQAEFTLVGYLNVLKGGIAVGTYHPTNQGWIEVVEIITERKVRVRFLENPCEVVIRAIQIRLGQIKNPMRPSVCDVGFIGVGEYGSHSSPYSPWANMLNRVYRPPNERTAREYEGTSVHPDWHNFQNFADWHRRQSEPFGVVPFEWHVDKDLRVPGNLIYGPDTCCLVPPKINIAVTDYSYLKRDLPRGVTLDRKYYRAVNCVNPKRHHNERFKSIAEAQVAYWESKFAMIRSAASEYRDYLPSEIFQKLSTFGWLEAIEYFGDEAQIRFE